MKSLVPPRAILALALAFAAAPAFAQLTPREAILKMIVGINLGRSLDLEQEGSDYVASSILDGTFVLQDSTPRLITQAYFTDIKTAGFDFVRIPIQWNYHTGTTSPYTVNAAWLNRVEQIVDWALAQNLVVIINSHHDYWILENSSFTAADLDRFKAIWSQVADRFKTKSENLFFEIANEPALSTAKVDQINAAVIPVIRATNPTRIIVYGGPGTQLGTLKTAAIPADSYLLGSIHAYLPATFAIFGQNTWGSAENNAEVEALFNDAADWAAAHDIPVFLGEFGTVNKKITDVVGGPDIYTNDPVDRPSRELYYAKYIREAARTGIPTCVWHDFGNFGIYTPTNSASTRWSYVKDSIIKAIPKTTFALTDAAWLGRSVDLTWNSKVWTRYTVDYSTNLIDWTPVAADVPAAIKTDRTTLRVYPESPVLLKYEMGQANPQVTGDASGATGGNLTPGAGLNLFNTSYTGYATGPALTANFSVVSATLDAALTNRAWFGFDLVVGAQATSVHLAELSFKAARGGSSTPRGFAVYVTTPTTTDELVQGATEVGTQRYDWGAAYSIDLSGFPSLQNLRPGDKVTFKIPIYAPGTGNSLEFDDLALRVQSGPLPARRFLRVKK